MVQPNQGYRAVSENPDERRAVEESFAQSVLWGFTAGAAERAGPGAAGAELDAGAPGARHLRAAPRRPYLAEIDRAVERVIVDHLMRLAGTAPMPQVRAIAAQHLMQIRSRYGFEHLPNSPEQAHGALLTADITRFLERDYTPEQRIAPPPIPPGAPIGDDGEF
jgi:hypothetical protein